MFLLKHSGVTILCLFQVFRIFSIMNSGRVLRILAAPHPTPRGHIPIFAQFALMDILFPQVALFQWSLGPVKPKYGPHSHPAQQLLPIQEGSPDTNWFDHYLGP